jgi:hypothetical protein
LGQVEKRKIPNVCLSLWEIDRRLPTVQFAYLDTWRVYKECGRSGEAIRLAREGIRLAREGIHLAREGIRLARKGIHLAREGIRLARKGIRLAREGIRLARKGIRLAREGICLAREGIRLARPATAILPHPPATSLPSSCKYPAAGSYLACILVIQTELSYSVLLACILIQTEL